jgi:hypothetical protein
LRGWVSARSGIHAPRDPAVQPADVGIALRLRAAATLEQTIDDLIERHLRVAGYALGLFSFLRQRMDGNRAQATAIRWTGITFHISAPSAQDSTPLLLDKGRLPQPGPSLAAGPAVGLPGRRTPLAGREFPGPLTSSVPSGHAGYRPGLPAGCPFPAKRPHPGR